MSLEIEQRQRTLVVQARLKAIGPYIQSLLEAHDGKDWRDAAVRREQLRRPEEQVRRNSTGDPRYLATLIAFDEVAGEPFTESDRAGARALTGIFNDLAHDGAEDRPWRPGSDRRAREIVERLLAVAGSEGGQAPQPRETTTPTSLVARVGTGVAFAPDDDPAQPDELQQEILSLLRAGDVERAEKLAQRLARVTGSMGAAFDPSEAPVTPDELHQHILRLRTEGRDEEALAIADRLIALKPDNPDEVLWAKVQILYDLGRYSHALGAGDSMSSVTGRLSFPRSLGYYPFPADTQRRRVLDWLILRVKAFAKLGRYQEALVEAERVLLVYPYDPDGGWMHTRLLWKLGRFDEARAELVGMYELRAELERRVAQRVAQRAALPVHELQQLLDTINEQLETTAAQRTQLQAQHNDAAARLAAIPAPERRTFGRTHDPHATKRTRLMASVHSSHQQLATLDARAAELQIQLASVDTDKLDSMLKERNTLDRLITDLQHLAQNEPDEMGEHQGSQPPTWARPPFSHPLTDESFRYLVALIDQRQGAHEQAQTEFTRVREQLRRELAPRAGDAIARHQLALMLVEQGAYEPARAELNVVLDLYRALGELAGETATRDALASIDFAQGAF